MDNIENIKEEFNEEGCAFCHIAWYEIQSEGAPCGIDNCSIYICCESMLKEHIKKFHPNEYLKNYVTEINLDDLQRAMIKFNHSNNINAIMVKTMEEIAELTKELSKYYLDGNSSNISNHIKAISDEIIDCDIMLQQLRYSLLSEYKIDYNVAKIIKISEYMDKHHLIYKDNRIQRK